MRSTWLVCVSLVGLLLSHAGPTPSTTNCFRSYDAPDNRLKLTEPRVTPLAEEHKRRAARPAA